MSVEIDFETRSQVNLKTDGRYAYFAHPSTDALLASYQIDDGPLQRWRRGQPCPDDLRQAIERGDTIIAHNAGFERLCMTKIMPQKHGWPMPTLEQFRCTQATALAMGLPASLEALGDVLQLATKKSKEGEALIRFFSIPKRDGTFNEPEDFPEKFDAFHDYCDADVRAEAAADRKMVSLPEFEQRFYSLQERINDRGIRVDLRSIDKAIELSERAVKLLNRELLQITNGAVPAVTNVDRLVDWVQTQGVTLNSGTKADIEELLQYPDIPEHVRRAVEIRQQGAKTSVAKLKKMKKLAGADGRIRGAFIYHKASTGRTQSVGVNLNNLPRPRRIFDEAELRQDVLFDAIRTGEPEMLKLLYGPELGKPMHLLSDSIRGFIWAAPGKELIQADYSGIEGAVIAWSSGEEWKVQEMHRIIADPKIPDLYRQTAASIMNTTTDVIDKKHPLRQSVGKVSELACFTAETKVLTRRGVKAIVEVLPDDLLWDGVEWIRHQGLIAKGVRRVVDVDGIGVTPDHLIRTGQTWTPAQELVSQPDLLGRALATGSANLPSSDSMSALPAACTGCGFNAPVALNRIGSTFRTSAKAPAPDVIVVPSTRRPSGGRNILAMRMWSLHRAIAAGCSIGFRLASIAARILTTAATPIMAGVASPSFGGTIAGRFLNISSHSTVGITRNSSSTASASTTATSRAISVSSLAPSTPATDAKLASCKPKSSDCSERMTYFAPVFDILQAGPRNRFLILSDSGALLVHNCGFGGGVSAFHAMAQNYGVNLDALFPSAWETASEERREKAVKRYAGCLKRGKEKTDLLSREAWIACELIKVGWRAANPAIAAGWALRETAVRDAIRNPGTVVSTLKFKYIVRLGYLWCQLPSGRCLAYAMPKLRDQVWAKLKLDDGSFGDAEVMLRDEAEALALKGEVKIQGDTSPAITCLGVSQNGKSMQRELLYGGILAENDTQAVARDLLVNGMWLAEGEGYPIVLTVYDEMIAEVDRGFGDLAAFEKLICRLPPWAGGLPLAAGGWRGKRYRKA